MSKQRTKYKHRRDGEGFSIPNKQIYKIACCDCGLVHRLVLVAPGLPTGEQIGIAIERDNRATAARRRKTQRAKS